VARNPVLAEGSQVDAPSAGVTIDHDSSHDTAYLDSHSLLWKEASNLPTPSTIGFRSTRANLSGSCSTSQCRPACPRRLGAGPAPTASRCECAAWG
jgi:hypothetical protein